MKNVTEFLNLIDFPKYILNLAAITLVIVFATFYVSLEEFRAINNIFMQLLLSGAWTVVTLYLNEAVITMIKDTKDDARTALYLLPIIITSLVLSLSFSVHNAFHPRPETSIQPLFLCVYWILIYLSIVIMSRIDHVYSKYRAKKSSNKSVTDIDRVAEPE